MNKKKAIKVITAGTIAASAFVAAAPVTTNAASVTPERATELIKAAYGAYSYTVTETGKFSDITAVYAAYNKAKDAYNSAVKTAKGAQLTALKAAKAEYLDKRVVTYIDAYNMGLKIKAATAKLDTAIKAEKLTDIVAAYTVKELGKSSLSILDRVYGKTTRDLLREMYTTPAGKTKDMVINEVTVATKIAEAAKAIAAGKKEDAAKALETAKMYLDKVNAKYKEELTKAYGEVAKASLVITAEAKNSTTVKVTFNNKIKAVNAATFTVTQKDVATNVAYISKAELAADGMSATLSLATSLTADKDYVVKGMGITIDGNTEASATVEAGFFYAKSIPTSIAFTYKTIKNASSLTDIISVKDQVGRDITKEVTLNYESSDNTLIGDKASEDLGLLDRGETAAVGKTGTSIVKVTVDGYSTITVQEAIAVSDSDAATFSTFFTKTTDTPVVPDTYKAYTEADMAKTVKMGDDKRFLHVAYLDQYGVAMDSVVGANVEYRSLTPLVVIVNQNGSITPIGEGTGLVEVTVNGVKAVVTIEVKAEAKLTSLSVEKDTVKVGVDGVDADLKVTLLDQYGDKIAKGTKDLKVEFGNVDYASLDSATLVATPNFNETTLNESTVLTWKVNGDKEGTTTVKVSVGDVTKTVPVVVSKLGAVVGYEIAPKTVELDFKATGDKTEQVVVYSIDSNGNRIADLTNGDATDPVVTLVAADDTVTTDLYKKDNTGTITTGDTAGAIAEANFSAVNNPKQMTVNLAKAVYPAKTATFKVKVNSLIVGTVAVKVVNSDSFEKSATMASTITFDKNFTPVASGSLGGAESSPVSLAELLFGKLTLKDQKGVTMDKGLVGQYSFEYILRGSDYTNLTTTQETLNADGVLVESVTSPVNFIAKDATKAAEMNIVLKSIKYTAGPAGTVFNKNNCVDLLSAPVLVTIKRTKN